ncbi:putative stress-induced protein STI1 [Pisolithus albus]|nr:putative stress-induced protein STI1 [Pisolithus albus]
MADRKQQLVLSIIDFLNKSIEDGTIKQDDREGLEVAIQCIGEAFGVDPSDDRQREQLSIKPATLQSIFEVFLKTRDRVAPTASSSSGPSTTKSSPPSAETRKQAEAHKSKGNAHMSAKNYTAAIDSYTSAIALDPSNPVFYSNRAAAHSSVLEIGVRVLRTAAFPHLSLCDFLYLSSRHAHYTLGNYRAAADAFQKGTELDPTNDNLKSGLKSALERVSDDDSPPPLIPEDQLRPSSPPSASTRGAGGRTGTGGLPNMAGLADMFRNMGGAGGAGSGGGMPDLASMMNNPMMMQMAQQLMANGGLEQMMSNPAVANMVRPFFPTTLSIDLLLDGIFDTDRGYQMNRVQNGGGLPSMEELMSDPTMRNL